MKNKRNLKIMLSMLLIIAIVLPATPVKANQSFTSSQIEEMVNNIGRIEISAPVTKVGVNWTDVFITTMYPSESSGLDTSKPYYGSNMKDYSDNEYNDITKWKSSDETVMTVKKVSGVAILKAVGEGTATITATLGDKSDSVTFEVNGTAKIPTVERVEIDKYNLDGTAYEKVKEGEDFHIDSGFYFSGNSERINYSNMEYMDMFSWKSSDESIVATDMGGNVGDFRAMSPGKTTLTLTVGGVSGSVDVTVTDDKEIQWVVPEMSWTEKKNFVKANGVVINNETELYKYVYDCLSNGIYNIAVYGSDSYQLNAEMVKRAVDLFAEYAYCYNKPTFISKDEVDYDGWHMEKIVDFNGDEAQLFTLYNPDAKSIIEKVDKKADSILKKIIKAGMSDKAKMKAIHDYLIKNCNYDMSAFPYIKVGGKTYYNKSISGYYNGTAYGALIEKKAICGGYSNAFNLLARKAGIQSIKITSSVMTHAWNMVKLDGKYKYIDVTWDDPISGLDVKESDPFAPIGVNKPIYTYFLISSSKLNKDHIWSKTSNENYYKNIYDKYSKYTIIK